MYTPQSIVLDSLNDNGPGYTGVGDSSLSTTGSVFVIYDEEYYDDDTSDWAMYLYSRQCLSVECEELSDPVKLDHGLSRDRTHMINPSSIMQNIRVVRVIIGRGRLVS